MLHDVGNNRDCDVDVDRHNNTRLDHNESRLFVQDRSQLV